jgi:hypothetical protein
MARNQAEEAPSQRRVVTARRDPVIDEMAIAKALEQCSRAELFQVLRNPRLAVPEYLGELRDTAFALRAKRDDAQPDRVCQGFELGNQLFGLEIHK